MSLPSNSRQQIVNNQRIGNQKNCYKKYKIFQIDICFSHIINNCKINFGYIIIIAIHKNGKNKSDFNSFGPISLEKNVLKLFCKLIFNKITSFVHKNNIISESKYRFRPGYSCNTQITDVLHYVLNIFNDKNVLCVDLIFLDMSQAFDRFSFKSILECCYDFGIRDNCLRLFENYLMERQQSVFYSNNYSDLTDISSGTPQ